MESASKVTEQRRINKPVSNRVQSHSQDQEQQVESEQPAASRSLDNLPTGPGTRALRQAAVLQMQHTHGNAHVMRTLDPSIQRQEEDGAAAAAPAGPSAISGSGGSVDTGGGGVEISGGTVKVHSANVEVDGVLQADTLIANSVVSSSYTPGAGNIY
jgi:hypothetical protein